MKIITKFISISLIVIYCFGFSNDVSDDSVNELSLKFQSSSTLEAPTIEINFVGLSTIDTLPEYINPADALSGILVDAIVNGGIDDGDGVIEPGGVILNWKVNTLSANTYMKSMPLLFNLVQQNYHYITRVEPYGNGTKIFWWVTAQNVDGEIASTAIDSFLVGTLGLDQEPLPSKFKILGNYPNPFNPSTKINFIVNQISEVILSVYSLNGELVHQSKSNVLQPGFQTMVWNGKDDLNNKVSSGVYIYSVQSGEHAEFKKMTLLK